MPTPIYLIELQTNNVAIIVWTPLGNGDSGGAAVVPGYESATIQVHGTFGAGGTIVIEGTLNSTGAGETYATLTDDNGVAMSYTSATIKKMQGNVYKLRPRVTGGDVSTALTVRVLFQGNVIR